MPLNRCKVFVVGPGRHGKTSLINSLMRRPFQEDCASTAGAVQEEVSCTTDLLVGQDEESSQINKWTPREAPEKELEVHFYMKIWLLLYFLSLTFCRQF